MPERHFSSLTIHGLLPRPTPAERRGARFLVNPAGWRLRRTARLWHRQSLRLRGGTQGRCRHGPRRNVAPLAQPHLCRLDRAHGGIRKHGPASQTGVPVVDRLRRRINSGPTGVPVRSRALRWSVRPAASAPFGTVGRILSAVVFASAALAACGRGGALKVTGAAEAEAVAAAGSAVITCTGVTLAAGTIGQGQSVSTLARRELSGTQDVWTQYVELSGGSDATFTFPTALDPAEIAGLAVQVNYRGSLRSYVPWFFELWDAAAGAWVLVADNGFAQDWVWSAAVLPVPGPPQRFLSGGSLRLRYHAGNTRDASLLDELVIVATLAAPDGGAGDGGPAADAGGPPDANQFPASALGRSNGWPGERWLDIRNATVRDIMKHRLDLAVQKGCTGVDPDNVDGYTNSTGFSLTAADQLDYNRFLAAAAHARGLAAGLKNDVEQVAELVASFEFAVNEECVVYSECDLLLPFIRAGKPVFHIEYDASLRTEICAAGNSRNFDTLIKDLDLSAARTACR